MAIKMRVKPADSAVPKDVVSIAYGNQDVDQVVLDGAVIWTRALMHDSFNRANSVGLGSNWTDLGDAESPYLASVVDGTCRLNIPDGLVGLNLRSSTWRWNPQVTNGDDGYIEARVANKGNTDASLRTSIWRRASNTGTLAASNGVGLTFAPSGLLITRKVGAATVDMVNLGAWADGETFRMTQVGNVHYVYRNGVGVGGWNDSSSTAQRNASHRSMGLTVTGIKPGFAARRFSASLDYIECR